MGYSAVIKSAKNVTYGSGTDTIVLRIAQDYYLADAQYIVTVDGKQVGGIFTASATLASGQADTLTLYGSWGSGAHDISITFLNDAYNGLTGEDRNLHILSGTMNGTSFLSSATHLWKSGSAGFVATTIAQINGTYGADTLVGGAGQDIMTGGYGNDKLTGGLGHDIFVNSRGDGWDTITDFTVSGSNSDVLRVSGFMISSFADLGGRLIQSGADTLVMLDSQNVVRLKNVTASSLTASNFEFLNPVKTPAGAQISAGTGADTLVLKLTQDFYSGGNAQYVVTVDGKQVGGTFTTSAVHYTDQVDTLTLHGDWGAGDHIVRVTFLNDAYNSLTNEDRNLYIESASINGVAITDAASVLYSKGSAQFLASVAALATAPTSAPLDTVQEVFDFTRGGGSEVIDTFSATGAGADVIRLHDYGYINHAAPSGVTSYTSFSALLPHITQQGSDTVITLSATDVIRLENVDASTLSADNFSFMSEITGPMEVYTNNGWYVFNNTWGSSDLVYGKDYTISSSYDPEAPVSGTTFTWSYPPPSVSWTKVLGYPSLMFGSDTYDNATGEYDPAKVLPIKIADLDHVVSRYELSYGGETSGFDVAYDIWLTSKPDGKWSDVTNEVMIWLHQGDLSTYGTAVGTYSDGTYSATIYHIGTYTALVPDKDYTAGEVDIGAILDKLQQLGIVSPDEYLNQIDLGAEPIKGAGYLTVNSLSYDIQSHDAKGIVTRDYADGGATLVTKQGTSGADVLSAGTAEIATLIGGGGNDSFVFTKGETGAVTVEDFHRYTSATAEHDLLKFVGYGSGATLSHESGDSWAISYAGGVDHIVLEGVTSLSQSDYVFL